MRRPIVTYPPLSETGPSPEEQAHQTALDIIEARAVEAEDDWISDLVADIAEALLAERREAHLQDARAGCEHCRLGEPPTKRMGGSRDGWRHEPDGAKCARPEVWDALSLLPPESK